MTVSDGERLAGFDRMTEPDRNGHQPPIERNVEQFLVVAPPTDLRAAVGGNRGLASGAGKRLHMNLTAPYFHNNSAATLEDVVDHYIVFFTRAAWRRQSQSHVLRIGWQAARRHRRRLLSVRVCAAVSRPQELLMRYVLAVCLSILSASILFAQPGPLERLLAGELARMPAKAGIYVKHLTTGEEAAVAADDRFNSASVIKIPVMVMAYQMADKGTLDLNARVTIGKADRRGGSGVLRYHDLGLQPTIRDVITQMIITSDNTATDIAIARVGGVATVNQWLGANRYTDLKLNSTILDVFRNRYDLVDRDARTLTPEDVYALGSGDLAYGTSPQARLDAILAGMRKPENQEASNKRTNEDPRYWLGDITPRGVGRMLEAIERGNLASSKSTDEMKAAFRRQQSGSRRLPHFIDVPVGHKTGDFPPVVANDVGVIYARSGPVVVSLLLNAIREPYGEAEDRMGEVARVVVEYFDGTRR